MRIDYWAKFEEHSCYHIYNRGINGENLFVQEKNYYFFLNQWKKYLSPYFDVFAYCLMPNHFHFLVRVRPRFKLWYLVTYIHHNPIHHRFCRNYSQWSYSSYNTYFSNDDTLLVRKEVLNDFDETNLINGRKLFRDYHEKFRLDQQMSGYHLELD